MIRAYNSFAAASQIAWPAYRFSFSRQRKLVRGAKL
jgi:hypothetical protein